MSALPEGVTPEDVAVFCDQHETQWREAVDTVLTEAKGWEALPETEWALKKTVDDCRISTRRYKDSPYYQLKAVKTVTTTRTAEEFLRFQFRTQDCDQLHDWYSTYDPLNVYYTNVHRFDPYCNVVHIRTASTSRIVWDRDLMEIRRLCPTPNDPNHCYFAGRSVDAPDTDLSSNLPIDAACVRAYLEGGFCYAAHKDPDASTLTVTFFLHVNPSGWVPSWLYNFVIFKKGLCVSGYLDMFMRFEDSDAVAEEDAHVMGQLAEFWVDCGEEELDEEPFEED